MKKFIKVFALIMVLVLSFTAFAACGGDAEPAETGEAGNSVAGETQTWGNITIFVPEGYTLNGGNVLDSEDPDVLTLNGESTFDYFMVSANYTQENAEMSIEGTRSANDGCEDVSIPAGSNTWTGVAYNSLGYDIVSVYAPVGEGYAIVTACSHAKDDATLLAVLESLEVK